MRQSKAQKARWDFLERKGREFYDLAHGPSGTWALRYRFRHINAISGDELPRSTAQDIGNALLIGNFKDIYKGDER